MKDGFLNVLPGMDLYYPKTPDFNPVNIQVISLTTTRVIKVLNTASGEDDLSIS